jgi:Ca2+-binding EF-hand superfamily protein
MKISTRFGIGVLALGLIALPGVGRAQERQERPEQREHREVDLNNISPLEALRNVQNTGRMIFVMADVNHDGQVSQQEATDAGNLLVGGFFFEADADGNGIVTREESKRISDRYLSQNPWMRYVVDSLRAQAKQKNAQNSNPNPFLSLTAVLDTNNDRQVQASELRQLVQTVTQSFFAAADTNRDGQMSPSEVNAAVAGGVRAMGQLAFQQADTDNNGQLSREEYDKAIVEPANIIFQIVDLNHDGQISQQEAQTIERAAISQIKMVQLPEPANSPTNLIESGKLPREAAPIPNFTTPAQNRPQPAPPR